MSLKLLNISLKGYWHGNHSGYAMIIIW